VHYGDPSQNCSPAGCCSSSAAFGPARSSGRESFQSQQPGSIAKLDATPAGTSSGCSAPQLKHRTSAANDVLRYCATTSGFFQFQNQTAGNAVYSAERRADQETM
jgi:hypothetical protein